MGIFLTILSISITFCEPMSVDKTREPMSVGPDVVTASIKMIQNSQIFIDDKNLLRRTAYVESLDGLHNNTFVNKNGKPYHGGIGQMDEVGFNDTQDIVSHSNLIAKFRLIKIHFGIDWPTVTWKDLRKPLYSMIAMRLFYFNVNKAIPRSVADQAAYWKLYYNKHGLGTVENFVKLIGELENQVCTVAKADIIFALDSSGSIGSGNFLQMLQFTENVVKKLPIATDMVNVGILQYSSSVRVELKLDQLYDAEDIIEVIKQIKYRGGGTNTHLGLQSLLQMALNSDRRLSGASQMGYVITDGHSNNHIATVSDATKVKNKHIYLCAIGVGKNYDPDELKKIASGGCVIRMTNFAEFLPFISSVLKSSCTTVARLRSMPSVAGEKQNVTGVTNAKSPAYYSANVPAVGLTVQLETTQSTVQVDIYVSYTETNPSSAVYDMMGSSTETSSLYIPPKKSAPRRRRAVDPTSNATSDNANSTVYLGIYGRSTVDTEFVVTLTAGNYVPRATTDLSTRWFDPVFLLTRWFYSLLAVVFTT